MSETREAQIAKARATDEHIAGLWDQFHEANDQVVRIDKEIADLRKRAGVASMRNRQRLVDSYNASIERLEADRVPLAEVAAQRRAVVVAYDKEHYEGWSRFFQVQHIHSSQRCSSFRPTTRIGWLPKVSGLTEAEAVAEYGAILCTICFPTAPVEWTRGNVDPDICEGSGKMYDANKLTGRERVYYRPTGTCSVCGNVVGLTARNSVKIRKHKKES